MASEKKKEADEVETGTVTEERAEAATDGEIMPRIDGDETGTTLPARRSPDEGSPRSVTAMMNVDLDVQVVLGSTRMPISQLLELSRGSIIELDRKIGAPVELYVSERVVARGDLVKVGENRLGVSLTQIVKDHVDD